MTSSTAPIPLPRPRRALSSGRLVVAQVAAAAAVLGVVWAVAGSASPASRAADSPRVALVVDAGPRPAAALARARSAADAAERSGAADVTVRVPRTPAEAAADVRYFAAQRAVSTVVAVGPLSRGAARAAASDYPGARFDARGAVPRVVR
jgi:basic membrane lipoprotein Med (substrate-binding protein (PBP1-ABC) superfamily)